MTAVTCISYLRSILVRLTERADPPGVRRFEDQELTVIVAQRHYEEYLEALLQINRYVEGDAWVAGELLVALGACAEVAGHNAAAGRVKAIEGVARTIADQARREVATSRDREHIDALMAGISSGTSSGERRLD